MSHSTPSNWTPQKPVWASGYLLHLVTSTHHYLGESRVRDVLSSLGKGLQYTYNSNEDCGLTLTSVSSFPFFSPPLPDLIYPPRGA